LALRPGLLWKACSASATPLSEWWRWVWKKPERIRREQQLPSLQTSWLKNAADHSHYPIHTTFEVSAENEAV